MKRILVVFGTRPEAIKLAPVIRRLRNDGDMFDVRVCVTAQHREMLDQVLEVFDIQPHHDLNLMSPNQSLFDVTAKALHGLEDVLTQEKPDIILVQGDTTTVLTSALAAYYQRIPVGHIEAGLRTNNKFSPFPEEINRRLTSVLSDYHFAPTLTARNNLLDEGVEGTNVHVTGNTVIDALYWAVEMVQNKTADDFEELKGVGDDGRFILVTGHRRENFGGSFQDMCLAMRKLAEDNRDLRIIYPVHLNPNVQKPVHEILGRIPNVSLIPPLSYLPFVYLMSRAHLILTDSGGIQEESPALGKPVLVMRDTTERPEGIEAGTARLVGPNHDQIVKHTQQLLTDADAYAAMSQAENPYGDGRASDRIAQILANKPFEPFHADKQA